MNLKRKNEKGITLVALVVTIVVLIILAVISINAVFGEDGIIKRAEEAKDTHLRGEQDEKDALESLDSQISDLIGGEQKPGDEETPKETTLEDAKKPEMLTKTENTELKIGEDTVWIPAKFKVHEDSAATVNEGIVITDGTNEFVWVPVSEASFNEMFAEGEVTLGKYANNTDDDANTGATTSYFSKLRKRAGDTYSLATVTKGEYSSSPTIREPDIVTSWDKTDSYAIQAGYENATKMAEGFVEDYTNMRKSIQTYGGFYIGRYELTGTVDNPTVKAGEVLTATSSKAGNWYGLYKACRNVVTGNNHATTTMIWGCQWDETMNWLKNTKFKGNETAVDSNSSTWGNYKDSTEEAALMAADGTTPLYGTSQHTGFSEKWSANKIFDLAGNYRDFTQEAFDSYGRVDRGRLLRLFSFELSCFSSKLQQCDLSGQQLFGSCHTLCTVTLNTEKTRIALKHKGETKKELDNNRLYYSKNY